MTNFKVDGIKGYMSQVIESHLPVPSQKGYRYASRFLFQPYIATRGGIEVAGLENLPSGNAPYILAANHRSLLDIPVLGQILLDHDDTEIHFVAKKELLKLALLAKYFRSTGVIEFDRSLKMSQQPLAAKAMENVLQNNGVLGMFPERTRRKGPKLQIEQRGLGMLAVANYAPIATAGIYGTEDKWGRICVMFGKTIYPGPLGLDSKRQRMVDMETEYQTSLQGAIYAAYRMAGVDPVLG